MKSLLVLLLVGLGLGFGYWKTQNPDTTFTDLAVNANDGASRFSGGFSSLFDGGSAKTALNERLDSIESDLLETQRLSDPTEINSRLDSLEAAVVSAQQAADPAVINGRLTDAERRMSASEAKLNQVRSDMNTAIQSFGADSDNKYVQTTVLDGRLELINRRMEEQAQQLDTDEINSALTALEADIASLQDDQGRSEAAQELILSGMDEKLGNFEARFNTLSGDASNGQAEAVASINAQIDQRIAVLEDKINSTTADSLRLESMTNELSAARVKLQAMEQSLSEANTQITDLTEQLATLETQSESSLIDGKQAQLRIQLNQLQDQMSQTGGSADVDELTNALQATRDRIDTLEQRVIDLPASSSEADEVTQAQSALQVQIQELENKLSDVQAEPDPNLVDSINQVEEKVSELAAKSFVTQEELRAQQEARSIEYKIYFEPNSTEITEDAGLVLNSFIAQEKNRATGVSIYGFTDRTGSATYNQALALQRATNVRSYLIQNGFSYTKIKSLSGLGEDASADEPDNQEDAQKRSVVLYAQQP